MVEPIGEVYRLLLWHHMEALRQKDEPKRRRIFDAIEVMAEIFPAEVKAWEDQYAPKDPPA